MATKDWKPMKDNVVDFLWENRSKSSNFDNYEIWVYKIRNPERKLRWVFKIKEIGGGSNTRQFKTKSEALAFARSYMRSH